MYRLCQAPNCSLHATAKISHEFYNCLAQYEYHYFCDLHQWMVRCPVHPYGRILCEVSGCFEVAEKYTRNHYTCLLVGQFHLFCQAHAQRWNCPLHPQHYRRTWLTSISKLPAKCKPHNMGTDTIRIYRTIHYSYKYLHHYNLATNFVNL